MVMLSWEGRSAVKSASSNRADVMWLLLLVMWMPGLFLRPIVLIVGYEFRSMPLVHAMQWIGTTYILVALGVLIAIAVAANVMPQSVKPIARVLTLPSVRIRLEQDGKDRTEPSRKVTRLGAMSKYVLLVTTIAGLLVIVSGIASVHVPVAEKHTSEVDLILLVVLFVVGKTILRVRSRRASAADSTQGNAR